MNRWILPLPPNRVRRNYRGGALLDLWEGKATGVDGERPEDWIASTTRAVNPGLPPIVDEGLALAPADGDRRTVAELLAAEPEHYLGKRHLETNGTALGFLVKLLDSAMRLHVQAHPDKRFARKCLNSRWGKLETYVILDARPETAPYIRLGFQRPPGPDEWRRIVMEQDIAAMDACFDPVPVKPGEVWYIPGGLPHAIGEGLLVLETMEPTDLVVRCEFEREGIVVPPQARFMQRDPDFALQIFDMAPLPVVQVTGHCRVTPRVISETPALTQEMLIGPDQTDCFTILRAVAREKSVVPKTCQVTIGIVVSGAGELRVGNETIGVQRASRFLVPSEANEISIRPTVPHLEVILIHPGELASETAGEPS